MTRASEDNASRARRAHARGNQEWDFQEGLSAEALCRFHDQWREIEGRIDEAQNMKKTLLAVVRSHYGRHEAETLKLTMKAMTMEPLKRAEYFRFNEAARRYVEVLEESDGGGAQYDNGH